MARKPLKRHMLNRMQTMTGCVLLFGASLVLPIRVFPETARTVDHSEPGCALCRGSLPVPVVSLSAAWLDSLARRHAHFNARQISLLDSLLSTGCFGDPQQSHSQRRAHLLARMTTINAYRDLVLLASDTTAVYEADEETLRQLHLRYSDVSLFSAVRLASVRMGLGHVCLRYTLDEKAVGESVHGGRILKWRIIDTKVEGRVRRLLQLDFPTGTDDVVKVLLAPHHSFSVQYQRVEGPPAPYEWFLIHDIEGAWLRKWGTHRPTAYMFWVSAVASTPESPATLPSDPLVGVRVYIPHLRLRMPLLPDVGFDDLREIELPMPILAMSYLESGDKPAWLGPRRASFRDWEGVGPVPDAIRRRFPDR